MKIKKMKFLSCKNFIKGQVTVFIIIGVVLLLGLVLFFSYREQVLVGREVPEREAVIEKLPTEFEPVRPFAEGCIEQAGTEALKIIGDRGGYIDALKSGMQAGEDATSSGAVIFSEGSHLVVPYWHYLKSSNKCTGKCEFSSEKPPLTREGGEKSIEKQIDRYVNENLKSCLGEFKALEGQGFKITEKGTIDAQTRIAEDNVVIIVDYLLEIEKSGGTQTVSKFYTTIDAPLSKMYTFAEYIVNLEAGHRFLEKDVLNLIVGFSGKSEDKLPPMAESDFGFKKTIQWRRGDVKENIKSMMISYIPLLQVDGSRNYKELGLGNKLKDGLYNQGMLIPNAGFEDFGVRFSYLGWQPYFDLNCDGEICRPESIAENIMGPVTLARYNFVYDLSWPVLVEIEKPEALKGEGYTFRFFLEGNIRNNEPMKEEFYPIKAVDVREGTMLCDPDKRNSGDITVTAVDADGNKLEDVDVAFTCGEESCIIGSTEGGMLKEKFPICLGGIISYAKRDYLGNSQFLNTKLDKEDKLNVIMRPIAEKKIEVKKIKIMKTADKWAAIDNAVSLLNSENAIINIKRKGLLGDEEFSAMADYNGSSEAGAIRIAPGIYDISIDLYSGDRLVIPEKEKCEGALLTQECYTLPKVELNDTYIAGGARLAYEITEENLKKDKIVFYIVNPDIAGIPVKDRVIEDLEQMGKVEEYSELYKERLKPMFE